MSSNTSPRVVIRTGIRTVGDWFLRNSRNAFLIFIVNYFVMIQIGINLIGKSLWFFLSGQLNNVFSRVGAYGEFKSWTDISVLMLRLFHPTYFVLILFFVAFFLAMIFLLFCRSNLMKLSNGQIKIVLLSQFSVITLIFIDLIVRMPELALFRLGTAGVGKLFVYVGSMFFTGAIFWITYYKIMLKSELEHQI